jgi:hypothetical protein
MESSRTTFVPEVELLEDRRPPGELSLVEIAERLERVTHAIEAERCTEREARRVYQETATKVEGNIAAIRAHARELVEEQRRRMASFDGMIGERHLNGNGNGHGHSYGSIRELKPGAHDDHAQPLAVAAPGEGAGRHGRLNIYEAVMRVWTVDKYSVPLTTSEISRAIKDVGYVTRAAPRSMKSTLNQALAKLCREKLVRRFRTDGTEIDPDDHRSRARKYMAWQRHVPMVASETAA